MKPDWNHQTRSASEVARHRARGERRICVTAPTGGGKTRMMQLVARPDIEAGRRVAIYTNRKMLIEQTSAAFEAAGIAHGVRAAGHPDQRDLPVQICSIQTEDARTIKSGKWSLHQADLVIVDEAGRNNADVARELLDRHLEAGATVVGFDATPLGLGGSYDVLVTAGTNSELRACGALVPAHHYGPDEPDMRAIGRPKLTEEISEKKQRKLMGKSPMLFGRVFDWWKKLNADGRPTILFAAGVPESVWFAEEFARRGVRAAHIDGSDVWLDGELYDSSRAARQDVLDGSRDGRIQVVCNRFVLREGVDAPWLYHGVFATVFGSLTAYLQSGGRLLRSHPTLDRVLVQDHGGNWWRYGSLNADRDWSLGDTAQSVQAKREDRLRDDKEEEPRLCPVCGLVVKGRVCLCGCEVARRPRSRPVVQSDGSLQDLHGRAVPPRTTQTRPDTAAIWRRLYWGSIKSTGEAGERTFRQARGFFFHMNGYWPPATLPFMPRLELDWYRRIKEVPMDQLIKDREG